MLCHVSLDLVLPVKIGPLGVKFYVNIQLRIVHYEDHISVGCLFHLNWSPILSKHLCFELDVVLAVQEFRGLRDQPRLRKALLGPCILVISLGDLFYLHRVLVL